MNVALNGDRASSSLRALLSTNSIALFAAATWAAFATWWSAVAATESGIVHVAALAAALVAWWRDRQPGEPRPRLVRAAWLLLGAYAVLAFSAPRFVALAVAFLAITVRLAASTRHPGCCAGLFLLVGAALPFAEIAQAFVGVPLRNIAASVAALLLRGSGAVVESAGVAIRDGDTYYFVDAACGGLRGAWSALFLAGLLATMFRLRWPSACALAAAAALASVLANALRTSALYWTERAPAVVSIESAHVGVGLASFALASAALVALAWRMRKAEATT